MTTIDIRKDSDVAVDKIRFADEEESECSEITHPAGKYIQLFDSWGDYVLIADKNVPNLIKALQKAIELGWTE